MFTPQAFPCKYLFLEKSLKQKYKAGTKASQLSMNYTTLNIVMFRSLFSWWCLLSELLEKACCLSSAQQLQ